MSGRQRWDVERADPIDFTATKRLLVESGLPTQGLKETEIWRVRDETQEIVGISGLEIWGRQGLLRSVAVRTKSQRVGVGRALVEHTIAEARKKGIQELFLITETAPAFFERFGFKHLKRVNVKGEVLNSIEFKEACAESAPVMMLPLY